jgi:hypothetical protein
VAVHLAHPARAARPHDLIVAQTLAGREAPAADHRLESVGAMRIAEWSYLIDRLTWLRNGLSI